VVLGTVELDASPAVAVWTLPAVVLTGGEPLVPWYRVFVGVPTPPGRPRVHVPARSLRVTVRGSSGPTTRIRLRAPSDEVPHP
jgi:hypothetical protein